MHMSDALISPPVAVVMGGISVALLIIAARKMKNNPTDNIAPLMGVMGAFIFAAQMINFTIPGTGSSGHIVGGILLASVLGPWAAFITLSSVLVIQAFFFADGGLLALGCNVFNMAACSCLIAFPLIYKRIVSHAVSVSRIMSASILSCVIGLELGALFVTIQTELSGVTALPIGKFLLFMLPIHLLIGIVEGVATAAVLIFIEKYKPELLIQNRIQTHQSHFPLKKSILIIALCALIIGGGFSWFASTRPDGLEWSIENLTGSTEPENDHKTKSSQFAEELQKKSSFMPDYSFKENVGNDPTGEQHEEWGKVNPATSLAGIAGGSIVLLFAFVLGMIFRHKSRKFKADSHK
ncbi:MAG: energy-coupling factor ABC transporter permease [Bacteroidales bacterium]